MPRSIKEMSHKERKKALRYLIFLKEKQDGTINLEDDQTAGFREYTNKEGKRSPNISIEAIMLSCAKLTQR